MEITNDEALAESIGDGVRRTFLTENRQIYTAEETNLPSVISGKEIYARKNQLVYRMNRLLFQEGRTITGAGKALVAGEQELAAHIRDGMK